MTTGERRSSFGVKDFLRGWRDTQYTEMENMVRAATSNDEKGPEDELLAAIARYVTRSNYYEMSNMMWKRINDLKYPIHVIKALSLCYYLLKDKRLQRQIAIDCNLRVGVLEKLLHYWNTKGKFKGEHVRDEVRKILKLLQEINERDKLEKESKPKEPEKKKETPKKKKPRKISASKSKEATPTQPVKTLAVPAKVEPQPEPSPRRKSNPIDELVFDDWEILEDDPFGDVPKMNSFSPPPPKDTPKDTPKEEPRKIASPDELDTLVGDGFGAGVKKFENRPPEEEEDEETKRKAREARIKAARERLNREQEEEAEKEAKEKAEKEERLKRAAAARNAKQNKGKEDKEREEREKREREERERREREERERQDKEKQLRDKERQMLEESNRQQREELERQIAEMRREKEEMERRMREKEEREKAEREDREKRERELEEARKESERLARDIQERDARALADAAERERLAREQQELLAKAERDKQQYQSQLDRERLERERLAREKQETHDLLTREQADREAQRLQREKEEREKAERDRLERERLEKEAAERLAREREELARKAQADRDLLAEELEKARNEKEKLGQTVKEIQERAEREKKEREAAEAQQRKQKEDKERAEKERQAKLDAERKASTKYVDENLGRELSAYAQYFNVCLSANDSLGHLLPLKGENDRALGLELLLKVRDGLLLAFFINYTVPDTIDLRVLNKPTEGESLSEMECQENINLVINAAKAISVRTKVSAEDLLDPTGNKQRVVATTDFVWELIRTQLLQQLSVSKHPELVILSNTKDGADTQERMLTFNRLTPEELLLRWVSQHVKDHDSKKLPDITAYKALIPKLLQFIGKSASSDDFASLVQQIGAKFAIAESDISHERLNLAFCASIFHSTSGLDIKTDLESARLKKELEMLNKLSLEGSDGGEQVAFKLWINSLNLSIDISKYKGRRKSITGLMESESKGAEIKEVFVHDLFHDLRDGLFLLRIIDHIKPGMVEWNKVEMVPESRFKKIHNCNKVIEYATTLKLVLVGVGGIDITDGNPKLTLALVWQLMRAHMIEFFKQLKAKAKERKEKEKGTSARRVSLEDGKMDEDFDSYLLAWANKMVSATGCINGKKAADTEKKRQVTGFRDTSLADSLFFLDLLYAVSPRVVDWRVVAFGGKLTSKDCLLNARYCVSAARKLGCPIFLLPEDIVTLKAKMIITLVASIMTVAIA